MGGVADDDGVPAIPPWHNHLLHLVVAHPLPVLDRTEDRAGLRYVLTPALDPLFEPLRPDVVPVPAGRRAVEVRAPAHEGREAESSAVGKPYFTWPRRRARELRHPTERRFSARPSRRRKSEAGTYLGMRPVGGDYHVGLLDRAVGKLKSDRRPIADRPRAAAPKRQVDTEVGRSHS